MRNQLLDLTIRRVDLAGLSGARVTRGESGAIVVRYDDPPVFLKSEPDAPFAELAEEIARLRWLGRRGIACPRVLDDGVDADGRWLLMTALPGRDLSVAPLSPDDRIGIAASALRALHAVPIADCPFDHRAEQRIARAAARLQAGLVDLDDLDPHHRGRTPDALLAELWSTRPAIEEPVLTHGDATLENLIASGGVFTGYVDCGRTGIADRHQDLALAVHSIAEHLGDAAVDRFLACYGAPVDPARMAFYRLLDEFF